MAMLSSSRDLRGVQVAEMTVGDAEAVEFSCLMVPVAEVAPDGQAALEERECCSVLALLLQQHPEPVRDPGQRCSGVVGGQLDRPLQPPPPFGRVTVLVPERGQRLDQPQAGRCPFAAACGVCGARFQRPAKAARRLSCSASSRSRDARCAGPRSCALHLLGERRVVHGVPAPGAVQFTRLPEALERVLADRLEHAHPRLAVGALGHRGQADVEQLGGLLQRVSPRSPAVICDRDRRQRIQVAAPGEHPRPPEHLRKVRGQQVIAPGDGVPQSLLPRRAPDVTCGQAEALPSGGPAAPQVPAA